MRPSDRPDADVPLDHLRARTVARVLLVGGGVGAAGAVVVGVTGGDGRAGALVLVLALALTCGAAALVAGVLAVVDEARGHRVPARRPLVALGLFLATAVLLTMGGALS